MDLESQRDAGEDITQITFRTGAGMGGWDDDWYTLELREDGSAIATGRWSGRPQGSPKSGFTVHDFRKAAAELDRLGFFALEEFYTDFRTCQASSSIEAVRGGISKRVVCEGGVQPEVWPRLIAAFQLALELADWHEESK